MKTVTVYPSILMRILCPFCGFEHKHTQNEPPVADFAFNCINCKTDFLVKLNVRHFYRKKVVHSCYYTTAMDVDNILDSRVKNGLLLDISRTGCGIEISKLKHSPLDERKGNIILIFFSFPGLSDLFNVQGEIVEILDGHKHKLKMGVNFINIDEHQQQRLSVFLMV